MATDPYTQLSAEDRAQIALNQVRQFEVDRFGHELNIARLEAQQTANPDDEAIPAAITQAQDAISIIDTAITTTQEQADLLQP